jgi:hypothetical protein
MFCNMHPKYPPDSLVVRQDGFLCQVAFDGVKLPSRVLDYE